MKTITLTTDFGTRDWYVGAMKGVIARIAPDARVIDITHEVEPQNVQRAAFLLARIWPWFDPGTIHLAIVDPGVGTNRRILAGRFSGQMLVAPDNGLVTFVDAEHGCEAVHAVQNERYFLSDVSSTFHGRDVMAPVAAHLANGVALQELGPNIKGMVRLPQPARATSAGGRLRGTVLYIDRFGTLVSNIGVEQIAELTAPRPGSVPIVSVAGGIKLPLRSTFAEAPPGEPVALIGGAGVLEIAINRGRAVDRFGPNPDIEVRVP